MEDLHRDVFQERGLIMSLYMIADLPLACRPTIPRSWRPCQRYLGETFADCEIVLPHGYFELDSNVIWMAALTEVPALAALLVRALDDPHTGS